MPVLMVSEKTWPQVGFSRKRSMQPSALVMTMPKSTGLSTRRRAMVASAPDARWALTTASRSMSVQDVTGDDHERVVELAAALRTEPAVPSGVSSVA